MIEAKQSLNICHVRFYKDYNNFKTQAYNTIGT